MDVNSEEQIKAAQNNSRMRFIWERKLSKKYQNITVFIVTTVVIFRVVWLCCSIGQINDQSYSAWKTKLMEKKSTKMVLLKNEVPPKRNFHSLLVEVASDGVQHYDSLYHKR